MSSAPVYIRNILFCLHQQHDIAQNLLGTPYPSILSLPAYLADYPIQVPQDGLYICALLQAISITHSHNPDAYVVTSNPYILKPTQ